ncbi:ROK family protein [Parapedobacter tibetensis]|uniref:ROK family protein n=1 Tax=Parapedobacter tibetensis TaxID=2972951 RepID=UPI00214D5887|nr:ROK family protein [Parapedobacter tibetensis]
MQQDNSPYVMAADVGGTHITAAVIHTQDWSILPHSIVRHRVNSAASAKSILYTWTEALTASFKDISAKHLPVGIAMPGPFDYDNGISLIHNQDKYDALYQVNIKQELASMLSTEPANIRFINDAAAFLQGEVFAGGHDDHQKILGITLGTGLGSAIWEQGGNAVDADLWDTPYQDSIMEEYLVTRWFVRRAAQNNMKVTGLRELLQLRGQHPFVADILAEYSHHLTNFIQFFGEREGTNRFIIGGNISKAWDIFHSFNSKALDRFDIHISQLGEHAALIGAASVFV